MKKILIILLILLLSQFCFAGRLQEMQKAVIAAKNNATLPAAYYTYWSGTDANLTYYDADDGATVTRTGVTYDGSYGAIVGTSDDCHFTGTHGNNINLDEGTIEVAFRRPAGQTAQDYGVFVQYGTNANTLCLRLSGNGGSGGIRFTYNSNRWVFGEGEINTADTTYIIRLNYKRSTNSISATINGTPSSGSWTSGTSLGSTQPTMTGSNIYVGTENSATYYLGPCFIKDVKIWTTMQ